MSCWLGGIWSDAEGASESERAQTAEQRCHDLVRRLYGDDDPDRYERLRSLEPVIVADLKAKIAAAAARAAPEDASRREQLTALLEASADVARETMYARRAADVVKRDLAAAQPNPKQAHDEAAAASALGQTQAFERSWQEATSELAPEARTIALLFAMDRMSLARGLPKRLKLIALERPFALMFGAPSAGVDTNEPPAGGVWLAYMTHVAAAAGHALDPSITALPRREQTAWGGTVLGIADRLELEAQKLGADPELQKVASAVAARVRAAYRASQDTMAQRAAQAASVALQDEGYP